MLNQVHIEGYVTRKQWTYSGNTFFRLATYRDPDRPRKESGSEEASKGRDQPDYQTVCVPAMLLSGLPVQFDSGQRVQVHGWLESREYDYTLAEFLGDAQADADAQLEVDPDQAKQMTANRTTTWITAERIVVIPEGSRKTRRNNKT